MKEQEQRIAIAEACGWTPIEMGPLPTAWGHPENKEKEIRKKDAINSNYLPDYCNDLNAMHEAEKVLDADGRFVYVSQFDCDWQRLVFATAAQRAEAFLKTIGKWEESK